jgi:hypothetical protein
MFRSTLRLATLLDGFLSDRLGRLYNIILGASLVGGISQRVNELLDAPRTHTNILSMAGVIGVGLVLLINQLAELSDRIDRRRERKAAARGSSPPQ